MIESIIKVADSLKIRSAIEGVEDIEQLALIKNVNCERAQGFYIGKPENK